MSRYKRQQQSTDQHDPDGWKRPGANRSKVKTNAAKRKENLEDSDSADDEELPRKFDETHRGINIKRRVPDRDRCQVCFDYSVNCDKKSTGDDRCTYCKKIGRICKPLQLNPDGSLPATRRYSKAQIKDDNELTWEERCHICKTEHRHCDAAQPINPRNPCTSCRRLNSYCCSSEQHERMKNNPKCSSCSTQGLTCDRNEPCDKCMERGKSRCTYASQDGTRRYSTLTNPIAPYGGEASRLDRNVDHYDPNERVGCRNCKQFYKREPCDFEPGGPPCKQCVRNADVTRGARCTNWTAPGKFESVATRMFKYDETLGRTIRDVTKTDNKPGTKRRREKEDDTANDMSTSDSDEGVEPYSEESRAATRRKLIDLELPNAFSVAMSLTAFQIPIDNALRSDPQSYGEAMKSPDSRRWAEAIQIEYDSLIENGTWKVVNLPPGRKALTTKWVLKKKLGPDGEILKYKARMVARGFQQVEGYDYTETYSGVVKAAAYRLLFALIVLNGWTCHQMDVVTAFLNGDVLEEIYIHPPQGYAQPGKVLRLLKALYGLKQSPRLWYRKLRLWLLQNGWTISKYDECVFYNYDRQLIITVYVDDINIFGPSSEHITPFKNEIAKAFKMTDAGRASWYLGMQLNWLPNGLHIHQNGFSQQSLGKYGLLGSKPANIPLDPTRKLAKETETTADPKFRTAYMSMTGSLNYLQSKTRWDLAFPVSLVSRFMTNPNQTHMDAVIQLYRYLVSTPEQGLFFRKDGNNDIRGFVDSDWGGDTDTGKSTTGWVFTLAGCPISWSSQRQKTVSSSSTEAEYIAASDACKELIWLQGFYNEIVPIMNRPEQRGVPLSIDNASALKLTKNPEFHGRTKHINIRHHFIRECVEKGEVTPQWIAGKENPADILTKALAKTLFLENVKRLGGIPSSTSSTSKTRDEDVGIHA